MEVTILESGGTVARALILGSKGLRLNLLRSLYCYTSNLGQVSNLNWALSQVCFECGSISLILSWDVIVKCR